MVGKPKNMRSITDQFILIGIGLGISSWIFESLVHSVLLGHRTFIEQALSPGLHELWMRFFILCSFILFGIYTQFIIKQRNLADEALLRERDQTKSLLNLYQLSESSVQDFSGFAVNECVKMSESELGFFGLINGNETLMMASLWSEKAMENCAIDNKPVEFSIENAGLWAEAIRKQRPIIINDYEKLDAGKKGYPEGHVPISRLMSIPIVEEGQAVSIVAVANKKQDYSESDIIYLSVFLQNVWGILRRKSSEEALIKSEALFREIYENMKSGSAIFTVINDGSKGSDYFIKKINNAGLKMEGKELEEVVGKSFVDIRPTIDSYGLIPIMKKVWETGESAILPIKIYIDELYSNYYENYIFKLPSGEVVTLYNDVTESKRAEEELQTERDKFQGVLNAIGEGLYIVNRDFTIEYQNEVLKKSFGDRKGDRCCSVFYQSKEPCEFCPLSEVLESGKMQNIEATLPDGRDYDIFFSPFADVDGNVKAIVLLRDITEKKTLQAEAMRVGHLSSLGELAAGVAHEINNPINGIISVAEILRDQCYAQGEDDEIPTRIIKEGDRIAKIVKNLLSFARDRKEEHNPAYVQDILKDALSLVEKQITRDGAKLNMDVPPDLPKIKARTQEIQQVFLNILSNARYALKKKFKGPHEDKILEIRGDTIEIKGRKHVRVTFYDRGIGISKNILDKICDPFFSTKPQDEGTGLGLSISHGIVKNHDGRLWFESVEGEYTKVIVDLPVDNGWELSDGESRE